LCRRVLAVLVGLAVGVFFIGTVPVAQGDIDYSIVRVRLVSMGNPVSVRVIVNGNYSIPENKDINLDRGKEYEVAVQSGKLVLREVKNSSNTYTLGTRFTFKQHNGPDSDVLRVLNASYGWTGYKGDMVVTLEGGFIRFTNHVYLETYLYGVVPYEMGNSWPLEALKAQAVAARTYAVRSKNPGLSYDVFDTQASQVYRGFNPIFGNSIRAVNDTSRMVLRYNGNFVYAFYSSSNGGWIEAGHETFSGIAKGYKPLEAKEDPYDPKNQWSFTLFKTQIDITGRDLANPDSWWSSISERNNSNYKGLLDALKSELSKKGYKDTKIVSIDNIEFINQTEGKRYRHADFTISFLTKNPEGYIVDQEGNIVINTEQVRLSTSSMRSLVGTMTMRSLYAQQPVLKDDIYTISGWGFGHGVGMSQFGAQVMANQNKTYKEILNFYYPESTIEVLNILPPALTDMPSRGDDRQQPPSGGNEQPPSGGEQPPSGGNDTQQPQPIYGIVKVTTSLNVRQGPGAQYGRIGSLSPNTRVQILEQNGEWYKIRAGNLEGYVHSDYVVLENGQQPPNSSGDGHGQQPPPPVDPPIPPSNEKKYAVVTASALNVRSGPSTKNHRIGMVVRGNKLTVLEKAGEWYKIEYNGLTGYVLGDYIQLKDTNTQLPSGGNTQPPGNNSGSVIAKGVVTAGTLNVRSGAGTGFNIIGKLASNAAVDILEKVGSWYKIKYGNTVGYVHGDYIKLSSNDTPSRGEQQTGVGTVTASGLNVRSGPGTNYSRIGFLNRNSQVTIIGQTGAWYKIKFGSTIGYVHSDYVKVSTAASSRGEDRDQLPSTAVVTATWLNVRTGPGINYSRIGAIKMNSRVTILQKVGTWYRIQYGTLSGYVSGEYLKF